MTSKSSTPRTSLTRRETVGYLGLMSSGLWLWACGGGSENSSGSGGLGGAAGSGSSGGTSAAGSAGAGGTGSSSSWATGGTASMSGDYADPFPSSVTACDLANAETEGPCTEAADHDRQDISEGYTGLPLRLALQVVDADCTPLSGAKVKVWHTQINGSYSGNTPNNGMCLKDQSDSSKHYFRGVRTTDASGRVDFDTCFPGWYSSRTVHIHFTVSVGSTSFTSQLVFDQTLVNEIFTDHPEYSPYGLPDTTNAADTVVGGDALATYTLETSRQSDGAMLASKRLVVPL